MIDRNMKPEYNTKARKAFVDMDGVIANFAKGRDDAGLTSEEFKTKLGSYRNLEPYPAGLAGVRQLIAWGFDVWIATKIPNSMPTAASEKLFWIREHLPELAKSVIITPNKGTLGGELDFLIDDRPHKAHCEEFVGTFLRFGPDERNEFKNWTQVLNYFQYLCPTTDVYKDVVFHNMAISLYEKIGEEWEDGHELVAVHTKRLPLWLINDPRALVALEASQHLPYLVAANIINDHFKKEDHDTTN